MLYHFTRWRSSLNWKHIPCHLDTTVVTVLGPNCSTSFKLSLSLYLFWILEAVWILGAVCNSSVLTQGHCFKHDGLLRLPVATILRQNHSDFSRPAEPDINWQNIIPRSQISPPKKKPPPNILAVIISENDYNHYIRQWCCNQLLSLLITFIFDWGEEKISLQEHDLRLTFCFILFW